MIFHLLKIPSRTYIFPFMVPGCPVVPRISAEGRSFPHEN
jgi:hypothetical protein